MPLSKLYEKPRSASKVRSFPVKVSTMDAEMKFDDIEVSYTRRTVLISDRRSDGISMAYSKH